MKRVAEVMDTGVEESVLIEAVRQNIIDPCKVWDVLHEIAGHFRIYDRETEWGKLRVISQEKLNIEDGEIWFEIIEAYFVVEGCGCSGCFEEQVSFDYPLSMN